MWINLVIFVILFRNKLNIKEAIDFVAEAWNNVTQTTIQNCWKKTGILSSHDDIIDDDVGDDDVGDNVGDDIGNDVGNDVGNDAFLFLFVFHILSTFFVSIYIIK